MPYTFKHGDRPLEGVTVQRAVGRGGFGEVYYALTDSGKQVALKYLRDNPEIELRGIAHVMNLKSPHLITIYDVRKSPTGDPFVIMEYVGGPSLRDMLTAEPRGMSPQKVSFLLAGMCKGLAYLHERGIVHRDLKPANIFYDDGYVKIGDYGLSKHMSVSQHSGQTVSVGTVHYMAPEIGSGSYTKAIDIYALGVILYEMLTGRLPFAGSSMAEILMRHLRDQPNLVGIPEPFARVIAKALAKDPKERYQDAEEMLAAVSEYEGFGRDVASFDVSGLTRVPRTQDAEDIDRTVTSPSPAPPRPVPPPPLDARAAEAEFLPLPERLRKKMDRIQRKLDRRLDKLEGRSGGWRRGDAARGRGAGAPAVGGAASNLRGSRWAHVLAIVLVTFVCGVVAEVVAQRKLGGGQEGAVGVLVGLATLGALAGVLLAHFQILTRLIVRNPVVDRVIYASLAGVGMLPATALAFDANERMLPPLIVGPLVSLLICDWGKRIEKGRSGDREGWFWDMFWPAMIGLVSAQFMDIRPLTFVSAGLCALLSALTHFAAAIWPMPPRREPEVTGGKQHRGAPAGFVPPTPPGAAEREVDAASPTPWGRDADARRAPADSVPWPVAADPSVAVGEAPVVDGYLVHPERRAVLARILFGILTGLAGLTAFGCFLGLAIGDVHGRDEIGALAACGLVALCWIPLLIWKTAQRYKRPAWFGTVRPLLLTLVPTALIVLGTIAYVERVDGDELVALVVIGAAVMVSGLVPLLVPGARWRGQDVRAVPPAGAATQPDWTEPRGPAVVIDARPRHGLATLGLLLLLAGLAFGGATAWQEMRERVRVAAAQRSEALVRVRASGLEAMVAKNVEDIAGRVAARVESALAEQAGEPIAAAQPPRVVDPVAAPAPLKEYGPTRVTVSSRSNGLLVLTPLLVGAGLLVWSRRGQGWGPLVRAAAGSLALLVAVGQFTSVGLPRLIGPGSSGDGSAWAALAPGGLACLAGLVLVLWPSYGRSRGTVVV
ncbi:MAG: protein kinase [Phycisphaerales bacterium]|nr:protein kinase [Phycisphaerales bacterium]